MILDRYLVGQLGRPLVVVLVVLAFLFAAFSVSEFLSDVAAGHLNVDAVSLMVALRTLIALEVLLPVSLYLTVVVGLGRLSSTRETVAMAACGYGDRRILRALLALFILCGAVSGALSMYVRPVAYAMSYELQARAIAGMDPADLPAGRFYDAGDGDRIIYVGEIDSQARTFGRVFMWSYDDRSPHVVLAREARYDVDRDEGRIRLDLRDLRTYREDGAGSSMSSDQLVCDVTVPQPPVSYKRKAVATGALLSTSEPKELAELQWRMSRPLGTIVLGVLAFLIGRWRPRRQGWRVIVAILAYAVYYQLGVLARTWVEEGVVGRMPGVWWVDLALAAILVVALWRRRTLRAEWAGP